MAQGAARRQLVGDQLDYKMIRAVSNFDDKKYVMQGIGLLGQAVHAAITEDDSFLKASLSDIQGSQTTPTENNTDGDDGSTDGSGDAGGDAGGGGPTGEVVNNTPEIGSENFNALNIANTDKLKKKKKKKGSVEVGQGAFGGAFDQGDFTPIDRSVSAFKRINHSPFFRDYKATDLYGSKGIPRLETSSPIQRTRRQFVQRGVFGGFDANRSAFGNSVASVPADPNAQTYEVNENTRIDETQRMGQLSFLGEAGAAFAEGYNYTVDRLNYKRRVWEQQARDFDEIQGEFNVPASGLNDFDLAIKDQSSEVINEYFQLYKRRNQMDPAEYASETRKLKDWSKQMKLGMEGIKGMIKNYVEDKDDLSLGSSAEILDLYETLAKGGQGLELKTINGITYLQGKTLGGRDITKDFNGALQGTGTGIAIKDLAGPNAFRYLKKFKMETWYNANLNGGEDGTGEKVDGLLQDNVSFRQDASGKFIRKQGVSARDAAGKVRETIDFRVDNLLNNSSRIRAIAGDRLGLDSDIYDAKVLTNKPGSKAIVNEQLLKNLRENTGGQSSRLNNYTLQLQKDGSSILVDKNQNPVSGKDFARAAVEEFTRDGLIKRIDDQAVVKELKFINYTPSESRGSYRASKINKYKMDFSKLIRTSELKPALGGKDEMYVDVDLPGLRNAFINIKDISGSRIEKVKNQDGKIERRLRLYGPQTDVTKTGPDGESTTTTTKQVGDIDLSVLYEPVPKKSDIQKYNKYIARRKTVIENLTAVAVGLEMSAYDQFDLNPNIRGDEGMGVEKFENAAVN